MVVRREGRKGREGREGREERRLEEEEGESFLALVMAMLVCGWMDVGVCVRVRG